MPSLIFSRITLDRLLLTILHFFTLTKENHSCVFFPALLNVAAKKSQALFEESSFEIRSDKKRAANFIPRWFLHVYGAPSTSREFATAFEYLGRIGRVALGSSARPIKLLTRSASRELIRPRLSKRPR